MAVSNPPQRMTLAQMLANQAHISSSESPPNSQTVGISSGNSYQYADADDCHAREFNNSPAPKFRPHPDNVLNKNGVPFCDEIDDTAVIQGIDKNFYNDTCEVNVYYPAKSEQHVEKSIKQHIYLASMYREQVQLYKSGFQTNPIFKDTFLTLALLKHKVSDELSPLDACSVFYCLEPEAFTLTNVAQLLSKLFPDFSSGMTIAEDLCFAIKKYPLSHVLEHADVTSGVVKITQLFSHIEQHLVILSPEYNPDLYKAAQTKDWISQVSDLNIDYLDDYSITTNILNAALLVSNIDIKNEEFEEIINFMAEAVHVIFLSCSDKIPESLNDANSINFMNYKAKKANKSASDSRVITIARWVSDTYRKGLTNGNISNVDQDKDCFVALQCDGCNLALVLINFDCFQVCINKDLQSFFLVNFPNDNVDYCEACFTGLKSQLKARKPLECPLQSAIHNIDRIPEEAYRTETQEFLHQILQAISNNPQGIIPEPYFIPR